MNVTQNTLRSQGASIVLIMAMASLGAFLTAVLLLVLG